MDISTESLPYLVVWFVCVIIFAVLLIRSRPPTSMPIKEKTAYTTRLLMNLTPIALILITDAEIQFGEKTGPFKRSYVIDQLYIRVPDEYKKYITYDNLDAVICTALPKAEALWADNPPFMNRT